MPSLTDLINDTLANLRFAREALARVETYADASDHMDAATLKVHRARVETLQQQLDTRLDQVPRKQHA